MSTETTVLVERVYGLLAEFDTPEQLLHATHEAYNAGFRRMDTYSPIPVHGVFEAMGRRHTWVPQIVLAGGLTGCFGGFFLCYYMTVVTYAHNVGGRPPYSWPAYIPITFECTVLFSALTAVIGMILLNGLPMPYHPVFNSPNFLRASTDRFFLCIMADDPKFDERKTGDFLSSLNPIQVTEVEE